jgi:2-dehydro-3-deoxyglucarate aldolase
MIENQRAIENIEEILSVPQLGFAFVGPADLSMSLSGGDPLADNGAAVSDAIDRTVAACHDAEVPIGRIRNSVEEAQQAVDEGYQIVRIGGDISSVRSTLGERLGALRD